MDFIKIQGMNDADLAVAVSTATAEHQRLNRLVCKIQEKREQEALEFANVNEIPTGKEFDVKNAGPFKVVNLRQKVLYDADGTRSTATEEQEKLLTLYLIWLESEQEFRDLDREAGKEIKELLAEYPAIPTDQDVDDIYRVLTAPGGLGSIDINHFWRFVEEAQDGHQVC